MSPKHTALATKIQILRLTLMPLVGAQDAVAFAHDVGAGLVPISAKIRIVIF
jgi:hypothetical protein